MKRILCVLLACLLMVCVLASCVKDDSKTDAGNKEDDKKQEDQEEKEDKEEDKEEDNEEGKTDETGIPEGYQLYSDGKISFAYPKGWGKQNGTVVILLTMNGNNITVLYEPKSDIYEKMTLESYMETYMPTYESMGVSISNVKIEKKETNGEKVIVISQNAVNNGVKMTQTQYIMAVGDRNYVVTVTEVVNDAKLVETVFQTLKPAQ